MLHLTDVSVRSLAPPAKGQKDYFCKSLPGFGVRVSHGGTRSFFLFTGKENNRHRQTIGRFGIITLAEARAEATYLKWALPLRSGNNISNVPWQHTPLPSRQRYLRDHCGQTVKCPATQNPFDDKASL